jgi:hypothetical protein
MSKVKIRTGKEIRTMRTGRTAFLRRNKNPMGNTMAIPVNTAKSGMVCNKVAKGVR